MEAGTPPLSPSVAAGSHTLLLGEADMSFARALGLRLQRSGCTAGCWVTATELGSPEDVRARYFDDDAALAARCEELDQLGVRVILGVDVTRLECNDLCSHWRGGAAAAFVEAPLWDDGAPPASHVIFNFPHTTRPGKMEKLLLQLFRSLRASIARGFARADCTVEMRLRHVGGGEEEEATGLIRSKYGHEAAAASACFELVSVGESDLATLAQLGYEHRSTKRNARCGHLELARVWTWRAAAVSSPSRQRLPAGCRRDVFFAPEAVLDRQARAYDGWKGAGQPQVKSHYLVRWRGHPAADECTWEPARDLDLGLRKAFDEGSPGPPATAQPPGAGAEEF